MTARDGPPPKTAFITVDGRRWRTSDPEIPAQLRQQLVNELMAARRAVRNAQNRSVIGRSRGRVNDAKLALGKRGRGWWLPPQSTATNRRIDAALRALLRSREPGRSFARVTSLASLAERRGERFCQLFAIARSRWPTAASLRFFVAVGL
jgi:hypothetical protein